MSIWVIRSASVYVRAWSGVSFLLSALICLFPLHSRDALYPPADLYLRHTPRKTSWPCLLYVPISPLVPSTLTQPAPERLRASLDIIHNPLPVHVWFLYQPVCLLQHGPLGPRRPGVRLDDVQLLGVVSCLTPVWRASGAELTDPPVAFAGRMTVGAGVRSEGRMVRVPHTHVAWAHAELTCRQATPSHRRS